MRAWIQLGTTPATRQQQGVTVRAVKGCAVRRLAGKV
jgi:hypothetical protein